MKGLHKLKETGKWRALGYNGGKSTPLWKGTKEEGAKAIEYVNLLMSYGFTRWEAQKKASEMIADRRAGPSS